MKGQVFAHRSRQNSSFEAKIGFEGKVSCFLDKKQGPSVEERRGEGCHKLRRRPRAITPFAQFPCAFP